LDFSKIEAAKLELEQTPFKVGELFEDIAKLHAPTAHSKGIEIIVNIDSTADRPCLGDPVRIRQIVTNLLGNAVKFTLEGYIMVSASIENKMVPRLRFSVRDTGVGIPPARIDAIFESFTQSDASMTRRYGGTGLGLTISRQLARLMGGEISVVSKIGSGSEFIVDIPIKFVTAQTDEAPANRTRGLRVLVCDDLEPARSVVARNLADAGYDVYEADSGASGLDHLMGESFGFVSVVLVDQSMPGMDGLEFAKKVRAFPAGRRPAVVVMSTATNHLSRADLEVNGVTACLTKPIRRSALIETVEKCRQVSQPPSEDVQSAQPVGAVKPWLNVLLVEDNPVNQKVATKVLKNLGCTVVVAGDGAEALEHDFEKYDVILMDCQMPRLDGFQTTREIRRREQRTGEHSIVIALTANALEEDRKSCMEAGMDEYIAKPIRQEALRDLLVRVTASKAA
jgi:CheY-like chemotaxis protein